MFVSNCWPIEFWQNYETINKNTIHIAKIIIVIK